MSFMFVVFSKSSVWSLPIPVLCSCPPFRGPAQPAATTRPQGALRHVNTLKALVTRLEKCYGRGEEKQQEDVPLETPLCYDRRRLSEGSKGGF